MTRTLLQEILECNRSFLNKNPKLLDPGGDPFLVIACIDPRLTGMLEACLGLPKNRAMILRNAGNLISHASTDLLRSVAAALYVKHAKEILVIGHTDCALGKFSASDAIEKFRAAGIPRSAFGNEDLRAWFGAFADAKTNIFQGIECLRKCGLVPESMKVHGLLVDTVSGSLEILVNGDERPAPLLRETEKDRTLPDTRPAAPQDKTSPPEKAAAAAQAIQSAGRKGPINIAEGKSVAESQKAGPSMDAILELILKLREIVLQERSNPQFKKEIAELSSLLKNERNPTRILSALEKLTRTYEAKYPALPSLLSQAGAMIESRSGSGMRFVELIRRLFD